MKTLPVAIASDSKYPCLKQLEERGLVVLFNAPDCGTVVKAGTSIFKMGDYRTNWNELAYFTIYNGPAISLHNNYFN